MIDIDIASCLQTGSRDHNEDDLRSGHAGLLSWAVLSDGAGGHRRGDEASRLVVATIDERLAQASQGGHLQAAALAEAVECAHGRLSDAQAGSAGRQRMHATVVVLWIDRGRGEALWAHVGDSRLYRVRDSRAEALTRDDSVVQQMVDAGFLTPQAARHHPRKNQLLSALGGAEPVEVHVTAQAQPLHDGDAFLLCSDGWWDTLEAEAIARSCQASADAARWLAAMRDDIAAQALATQDNFSAVALRLHRRR